MTISGLNNCGTDIETLVKEFGKVNASTAKNNDRINTISSAYNELKEEQKKQRQAMENVAFSIRKNIVSPSLSSHIPTNYSSFQQPKILARLLI